MRRSHSPGVIRPPFVLFPAAGVGIASQNPFFERISGPVSCAPMMTGAFDQTSAAAFRLSPDFGKLAERIELARRVPIVGVIREIGDGVAKVEVGAGLAHPGGRLVEACQVKPQVFEVDFLGLGGIVREPPLGAGEAV